jgi:hypothetical protein
MSNEQLTTGTPPGSQIFHSSFLIPHSKKTPPAKQGACPIKKGAPRSLFFGFDFFQFAPGHFLNYLRRDVFQ